MSTAYLVTRGAYSDYRVVCVAASREVADEIVAFLNRAEATYEAAVEELPIVSSLAEAQPRQAWTVWINKDGDEIDSSTTTALLEDELYETEGGEVLDPNLWSGMDRAATGESYRGHDVALKAARDALAQRKATEAGV